MAQQTLSTTGHGRVDNDTWLPLAARILLVIVFAASGLGKIPGFDGTAQYMAAKGIPMVSIALPLTIVLEVGAAALIAVGYQTRWAALALVAFTLVATLIFHPFWAVPAEQAQLQTIMFMKNLGLIGGLLLLTGWGPGRWSLDSRFAARHDT